MPKPNLTLVAAPGQRKPDYTAVAVQMQQQVASWLLWKYTSEGRKLADDWTYVHGPDAKYKGANDPALHLSYGEALAKLKTRTGAAGLAVYLPDAGVQITMADGRSGFAYVLDLDGFYGTDADGPCWEAAALDLWELTGRTYAEVSPSGTGLKLFMVCGAPPTGKFVYDGFGPSTFSAANPGIKKYAQREIEVFSKGFFLTVTGTDSVGELQYVDAARFVEIMQWLDAHGTRKAMASTSSLAPLGFDVPAYIQQLLARDDTSLNLIGRPPTESALNVALVEAYLSVLDAGCNRVQWLKVIFSVAAHEWDCGEELARSWSMTWSEYNETDFITAWQSFDPNRASHGTLRKLALDAGWKPPVVAVPTVSTALGVHGTTAVTPATPAITPALAAQGWEAPAPRFGLASLTADRLFTGVPPAQDWLVEGIFPRGKLAVLASPPGIGKSYLALELSRLVSGDKPGMILGGYARAGGRAIYVSAEDDKNEIHRRLHALVAGADMPERLHVLSLPDVGHFGIIQADQYTKALQPTAAWLDLVGEIKSLHDVRLVVLDTLQALSTGDTNSADAVQPLLNECSELAAATGATVMLIHHVGKSSTRDIKTALDAAESIRGSGAIVGSARAAYVLWSPADGGRKLCEMIDEPYVENALAIGIVAKANGAASRERTYFLRDKSGLLCDITARVKASSAEDIETSLTELMGAIKKACDDGAPFAASYGANGLHTRRHELTEPLREKARPWFDKAVGALINADRVKRIPHKSGHQLAPAGYVETDDREGE